MSLPPEATNSEGLRRAITEDAPEDLVNDFRLYEEVRANKIRDQHIAYARSVAKALSEGKTLEYVALTVSSEVLLASMDVPLTVQLINYFLKEGGHEVRFDHLLNIVVGDEVVIASGATNESISEYTQSLADAALELNRHLVEETGKRLVNGFAVDRIMPFVRDDIVWESMDSALFSTELNRYLKENGSLLRFNRYLELAV